MLPTSLQDPTMLMEVSEATWRKVFDAAGETQRLADQAFKYLDIESSLTSQPPGADLFNALELIHDLGTDDGRTHIEQVAQDQPVTLPVSPDETAAREFVAQLWIIGKSDPAIAELLLRSQLTQRPPDSSRTYREFVGAGSAPEAVIDKEQLKAIISQWCRENGKSDVISITPRDYNGEWYCLILRGDPPKRVPEVRGQRLNVLEYQPAATDLLRYDPKTGRIGIATRSPQLLKAYRGSLGTLLAGNDQFFAGENVCSLQPLQLQGNALFRMHRVLGIHRIDVVQLLWRRGERDKIWVSGRDCFQILQDLEAKLREGDLIEARLKVQFSGGGRLANVTLKVPNIIQISGPNANLVEQLLDAAGLRGNFNEDGDPRTFWSEHPWRLKEAEWRRRLGADFDRLLAAGVLRPVTLDAVDHPDHPHARRTLEVEDIEPGVALGVSKDPAIGVRTVTVSDVEGYQLQIPTLAQQIKASLGLEGGCAEVAEHSGLWSLGIRTFGPNMTLAAFLIAREPDAATAAQLAATAGAATPLALFPCNCKPIEGVSSTPCRLPQGPYRSLLEEAIRSLKWHSQIAPAEWSSAELIIDTVRGVISYRGLAITGIQADTHPFKFAAMVARANGQLVATTSINDVLSPQRPDNDAAKTAKRDFMKAIKTAHDRASRPQPTEPIFGSSRGGYWLKATALVHA